MISYPCIHAYEKGLYRSGLLFHRRLPKVAGSTLCRRGGTMTLNKNLSDFPEFGAPLAVGSSHYKKFIQNSFYTKTKNIHAYAL